MVYPRKSVTAPLQVAILLVIQARHTKNMGECASRSNSLLHHVGDKTITILHTEQSFFYNSQ